MLLATYISLFQTSVATQSDTRLLFRCPDGYFEWDESSPTNEWSGAPTEDDWYFGNDWATFLADGTTPPGKSGVFPAGFRQFVLPRWSEPPICIKVGKDDPTEDDKFNSSDKKVEILMESPMDNVNLCINDASYTGVGNNDVGSVAVCGTGKLYACFTAAITTGDNFGFYVDCKEGCEDMDIDVWIRIRVSDKSWDDGKDTTSDDLEHWCEQERGEEMTDDDFGPVLYYTYPSDLVPDEPSKYPFHIRQIFGQNAGSQTKPNIWAISLIAVVGLACLFV